MKSWELLRTIADRMERNPDKPGWWGMQLVWPKGQGRFPFAGGDTELLCDGPGGSVYYVSAARILNGLAKAIKT
jgi:hypothetical protein